MKFSSKLWAIILLSLSVSYACASPTYEIRAQGEHPELAAQAAATKLLRKLGFPNPKIKEAGDYIALMAMYDSFPLLVVHGKKRVCLTISRELDVDKTMRYSSNQSEEVKKAVFDFIANHEAAHCQLSSKKIFTEAESWMEESRADAYSVLKARTQGMAGYFAVKAWRERRLSDYHGGNTGHYTLPLGDILVAKQSVTISAAKQALADTDIEKAFQYYEASWRESPTRLP